MSAATAVPSTGQRAVDRPTQTGRTQAIVLYSATFLIELLLGATARRIVVAGIIGIGEFVVRLGQLLTALMGYFSRNELPPQLFVPPQPPGTFGASATLLSIGTILGALILWWPLVISLLTFLGLPGGFLLTRFWLGARHPSSREKQLVAEVLQEIVKIDPHIRMPSGYYILDKHEPLAYVIGTTLYIHAGLLSERRPSSFRYGLLAHELGHLNSWDGRLILALRRFTLPPVDYLSRTLGTVAPGTIVGSLSVGNYRGCLASAALLTLSLLLALAGGGIGALLLNPLWVSYWRQRDYAADRFAQYLKLDGQLIDYLKHNRYHDVATPYFLSPTPSSELRIDRLLYGSSVASTMPLPKRQLGVLIGCVVSFALVGFMVNGGPQLLGFGPQLEDVTWEFVSFTDASTVTLDRLSNYQGCYLFFGYEGIPDRVQVNCFAGQTAYTKAASFSYFDRDTVDITPLDQGLIPFFFGGVYDIEFEGDNLIMRSTATGYTLRWRREGSTKSLPTSNNSGIADAVRQEKSRMNSLTASDA